MTASLSPDELGRRRARVADALVRTIRSVPVPGVPPFSRQDVALVVAVVLVEAAAIVVIAALASR